MGKYQELYHTFLGSEYQFVRNANANRRNKKLTFKSNNPDRSCIAKNHNAFIDYAGDLDIAMQVCM